MQWQDPGQVPLDDALEAEALLAFMQPGELHNCEAVRCLVQTLCRMPPSIVERLSVSQAVNHHRNKTSQQQVHVGPRALSLRS